MEGGSCVRVTEPRQVHEQGRRSRLATLKYTYPWAKIRSFLTFKYEHTVHSSHIPLLTVVCITWITAYSPQYFMGLTR